MAASLPERRLSSSVKAVLILDTSTIITLCELDATNILAELASVGYAVVVPKAVADELGNSHPCRADIEEYIVNLTEALEDTELPGHMSFGLGPGEVGAIRDALRYIQRGLRVCLVLDDKPARRKARQLEGRAAITGTLGLIILACEEGVLDANEAKRLLHKIRNDKLLHLDEETWQKAYDIYRKSCLENKKIIQSKCLGSQDSRVGKYIKKQNTARRS